jgi:hypothetical protein
LHPDTPVMPTLLQGILDIANQEQNLPGLDKKMDPLAKHTLIECWDNDGKPYLKEYKGSGKLEGKTALVTGMWMLSICTTVALC